IAADAGTLTRAAGNPLSFTVVHGAATKIAISASASGNLTAGDTRTLTGTIQDAFGNTVTSGVNSTLSITFLQTSGGGAVSGLGSVLAVNGQPSKTVFASTARARSIAADAGTLTRAAGNPLSFTVVHGAATKIAISASAS